MATILNFPVLLVSDRILLITIGLLDHENIGLAVEIAFLSNLEAYIDSFNMKNTIISGNFRFTADILN